jgi:hypothetical protein
MASDSQECTAMALTIELELDIDGTGHNCVGVTLGCLECHTVERPDYVFDQGEFRWLECPECNTVLIDLERSNEHATV